MACTSPMIRAETKAGKVIIKSKKGVEYEEWKEKALKGYEAWRERNYKKFDIIPCGQCIGCRLERSRQWANRIVLEMKEYPEEKNWFITLTYDDEHIPTKEVTNTETGEKKIGLTLNKKDLQDFLKRLRSRWENKYDHQGIRYFACGEYGETTNRPHYHLCIMNLPITTELKKLNTKDENALWTNEEIEKTWGQGNIAIGKLNWETAAYTARYIMKKQLGQNAEWFYKMQAKEPEFTVMSRKPGIGQKYYQKNKEKIYNYDEITIPKKGGAKKIKPPKYFDRMYKDENEEKMEKLKEKRKTIQKMTERQKDIQTTQTAYERRKIQEATFKNKNRQLKRSL